MQENPHLNQISNERLFEALFDYATIGIIVTDNQGKIVNFNKYAETQFGYSKEEVTGKTVEVLVPSQFHLLHINYRKGFYKNPEPRKMGEGRDLFALKKDGTQFPVEISLSYYEIDGKTFVIAFVINITVRKKNEIVVIEQKQELEKITKQITQLNVQLEQKVQDRTKMLRETLAELEKSKEELSEALEKEKELGELKSRFVSMASHEFRTPLATILSSLSLATKYGEQNEKEKQGKHITKIKSSINNLTDILNDFLSVSKLEEGKLSNTPEKFN